MKKFAIGERANAVLLSSYKYIHFVRRCEANERARVSTRPLLISVW